MAEQTCGSDYGEGKGGERIKRVASKHLFITIMENRMAVGSRCITRAQPGAHCKLGRGETLQVKTQAGDWGRDISSYTYS